MLRGCKCQTCPKIPHILRLLRPLTSSCLRFPSLPPNARLARSLRVSPMLGQLPLCAFSHANSEARLSCIRTYNDIPLPTPMLWIPRFDPISSNAVLLQQRVSCSQSTIPQCINARPFPVTTDLRAWRLLCLDVSTSFRRHAPTRSQCEGSLFLARRYASLRGNDRSSLSSHLFTLEVQHPISSNQLGAFLRSSIQHFLL